MKKILALSAVALLFCSCAGPLIDQAPARSSPAQRVALPQESPPPDALLFAGRSVEEVFVAAKIVLTDLRYAVKSSDPAGRLLIATRRAAGAGETNLPTATVMIFTDPGGSSGVKVQVVRPGQGGDPSGENRAELESILAAIQDLLR
jgi:hypothetical protein